MGKYLKRQNKRQIACFRALQNERRMIRMMHEKTELDNFDNERDLLEMYNNVVEDKVKYEDLDSTGKKMYNKCLKKFMYNNVNKIAEMERCKNDIFDNYDLLDEYQKTKLIQDYRELDEKIRELKRPILEKSENRKMFNECKNIVKINKFVN